MKITCLSKKKVGIILGFVHETMESQFLSQFLIGGNPHIPWNNGLKLEDIEQFAERCNKFEIKIIGFEVHTASNKPLIVSVFEEFGDYESDWYLDAIEKFKKHGIQDMIVPYVQISKNILKTYLSNYE